MKKKMRETFKESQKVFKKSTWIGFGLNLGLVDFKLKTTICRGGGGKLSQTIRGYLPELFNKKKNFWS